MRRFEKFHGGLRKLVNDLVGDGMEFDKGGEEDLQQSWRFVKDLVTGYVEVKKKLELLESQGFA